MDLFQIMCVGGCGDGPSALIQILRSILNVIRFLSFVIMCVLIVFTIVKYFEHKNKITKKELIKKLLKYILIFIVIFFVLILINTLIGIYLYPEYDETMHCWCK